MVNKNHMRVSLSWCCHFILYVVLTIGVVLLAIIVKHKQDEKDSPKKFSENEDFLENKLIHAVDEMRYNLITRFPQKKVKTMRLVNENSSGIKSISWLNRSTFTDAVETRRPFVMYDSPASRWEALAWDLWNISTRWPLLKNVLVIENESLMILQEDNEIGQDSGGLIGVTNDDASHPDVIYELLMTNFLFHAASPDMFMLSSSNYRVMESIAELTTHTRWRMFRYTEQILENAKLPQDLKLKQPSPGITLAHPGLSLQAKYSPLHTCRIQLLGVGRYVLFPPSKQTSLYLFPAIHTSHGQSQVRMFEELEEDIHPADSQFPLFKTHASSSARAITLNPGDVLYLPPYWLVRSEFPMLSVFLDVPSLSEELLHFKEAEFTNVPLGIMADNDDERIIGAQVYVMHFLSRIDGLKSPKKYAESHYKSRYAALYPKNGLFMKRNSNFKCFEERTDFREAVIEKMDRQAIEASAQHAADCVNEKSISSAIRWIFVGDYIDKIARWAMQDPVKAVLFLTSCLNFDSKLKIIQEVEGPGVIRVGTNAKDEYGNKRMQS